MGCGASKGSSKAEGPGDIVFKPVGAASLDAFFGRAKGVLDQLVAVTGPL